MITVLDSNKENKYKDGKMKETDKKITYVTELEKRCKGYQQSMALQQTALNRQSRFLEQQAEELEHMRRLYALSLTEETRYIKLINDLLDVATDHGFYEEVSAVLDKFDQASKEAKNRAFKTDEGKKK